MLAISELTIRIAGRLLIDQASVTVPTGARAGLVGRNGSGKTTLFRAIGGDLTPDTGSITIPRGLRLGQVAQEAPGTEESLIDIVLAADIERAELMAAAESESDPHKIADIHTRLADIDAHAGEARAASILAGLGFDDAAQKRPVGRMPNDRRSGSFSESGPTAAELTSHEVWAVNALHGIRTVTSINGVALPSPVPQRLAWFREALDRTWEAIEG